MIHCAVDYDSRMQTVAFDTETWLIQPGRLAPKLVCMTFAMEGKPTAICAPREGIDALRGMLENENVIVLGANTAYDIGVVLQHDPNLWPLVWREYNAGRLLDVQIWDMLYAIKNDYLEYDPRSKKKPAQFNLEVLSNSWLHETMSGKHADDAWRFRYHELDGTPLEQWPEEAKAYAMHDADMTLRVWQQMHAKEGRMVDLPAQCRAAWALHLLSARGLITDETAVRALERRLLGTVDVAMQQLTQWNIYTRGGTKKEPKWTKNTKLIQHMVLSAFEEKGQLPPKTEPSATFPDGQVKYDEETLLATGDPKLRVLAESGGDVKLLNTYVPLLLQGTQYPLNPRYQTLVATGRCSSYNPNVQNQPRKGGVRECFVPRVGYVFLECDYNIAEIRALAQVLTDKYGQSEMAKVIAEGDRKGKGYDVHCFMAAAIMQIPIDDFAARFRKGDKECKSMRQLAKVLNLGAYGGIGGANFTNYAAGYGIDIPEERSKELLDLYRCTFPEMRTYFNDIGAQCGMGQSFTLIQHGSGRVRGGVRFCDGANSYVQGKTADGAKHATYLVCYECYSGLRHDNGEPSDLAGCYPSAFIHDELILEAPFATAQAAAKRLQAVMEEAMRLATPDIPSTAEPLLMRRWYKEAEPVFEDGKLVPWSPVDVDSLGNRDHLSDAELEVMAIQWDLELQARERNPDPWLPKA